MDDGFKKCACGEIFHPPKNIGEGGYCKLCRLTMQLGGSPMKPLTDITLKPSKIVTERGII